MFECVSRLERRLSPQKTAPSAFLDTPLQTDICIAATVRQANDRGYAVTLVQDAHSTFDADLPAEQIIDQYNRQLGDIARVVPAESIDFSEA